MSSDVQHTVPGQPSPGTAEALAVSPTTATFKGFPDFSVDGLQIVWLRYVRKGLKANFANAPKQVCTAAKKRSFLAFERGIDPASKIHHLISSWWPEGHQDGRVS